MGLKFVYHDTMGDKIRAFIAVEIENKKILDKVIQYQGELEQCIGPLKLVNRTLMHLTVKFLGNISLEQSKFIYEFLAENYNKKIGSIDEDKKLISVKSVGHFGKRAFFVGVKVPEYLNKIHQDIENMIKNQKYKIQLDNKKFHPHLTVARSRKRQKVNSDGNSGFSSLRDLNLKFHDIDFGEFLITKIYLKQSNLTPQGPIYTNIEY